METTAENRGVQSSAGIAAASFFPGSRGHLYMMDYPPASELRGTLLFVNPFAAEASHSRRVIARLGRELSKKNIRTIIIDHYGCGDSEGEFQDARWEIWRDDLLAVCASLAASGSERLTICGFRLGAILAAEIAGLSSLPLERVVLMQPVLNGGPLMSQFIRSHLLPEDCTPEMLEAVVDTEKRRAANLKEPLNVDGYLLAPELIRSIDNLKLEPLATKIRAPLHWLRILKDTNEQPSPGSERTIQSWQRQGLQVDASTAYSWPFWTIATAASTQSFFDTLPPNFPAP